MREHESVSDTYVHDDILFVLSGRSGGGHSRYLGKIYAHEKDRIFHVIYIPLHNYIRCLILIRIKNKSDYSKAKKRQLRHYSILPFARCNDTSNIVDRMFSHFVSSI